MVTLWCTHPLQLVVPVLAPAILKFRIATHLEPPSRTALSMFVLVTTGVVFLLHVLTATGVLPAFPAPTMCRLAPIEVSLTARAVSA